MKDDKPVEQISVALAPKRKPRREISQATAVKKSELYVARRLPKYLRKLEELAMGILMVKAGKEGEETIYAVGPDRAALEYLIDRGMGKAPQRFEIQADGGNQLPQAWVPDELAPVEAEVRELTDGEKERQEG